jgi:large subunit ribosomal protein L14
MIQTQTILKVADNSGAKTVKCIKILGQSKSASVGDCIIVSVRSVRSGFGRSPDLRGPGAAKKSSLPGGLSKRGPGSIQKGQIFKALVIRTKKSGSSDPSEGLRTISFQTNEVVLMNNQGQLLGSRLFGPITRELRSKGYKKVISQSKRML